MQKSNFPPLNHYYAKFMQSNIALDKVMISRKKICFSHFSHVDRNKKRCCLDTILIYSYGDVQVSLLLQKKKKENVFFTIEYCLFVCY